MFTKILIANRGEIACRVIRTAKKLGIATVVVYSDADAQAQHVKLADEAIYIGQSQPNQSYLQIDKIIAAANRTGSQAIHPGYGFLSENDQFALACEQNNICFIGPPVSAILAMGLKATSKALMEKAGVPLTPGYHGDNQDPSFLKQQADQIGYPVLIKASAGGGGKGMSLVESSTVFLDALASCKREAKSSFGNDDVLIERYVIQPRHIEVQVFGDSHGNYVHLFERDCSVQRRHQKVLEEAPAPEISQDKLATMRQAAIDAAKAVNYVGAGTVEFIVEQDGTAYFMEMNTRLQVEHPVTEMVTGEDLVEWQLRIAYGEPLPKTQQQIQCLGHAIEARIYAEVPEQGYLPAIGKINYLHYPEQNQNVRIDSGIVQGDEITTYYDPMIAKLIVWGKNRDAALVQMHHALQQFHVDGLGNNIAFLDRIIQCDSFQQAKLDTSLIEREHDHLFNPNISIKTQDVIHAAFIKFLSETRRENATNTSVWQDQCLWRLNIETKQSIKLKYQQTDIQLNIGRAENTYYIDYLGQSYSIDGNLIDAHTAEISSEGIQSKVSFNLSPTSITLYKHAKTLNFEFIKHSYDTEDSSDSENLLKAPMPGTITQVFVDANQSVKKNDILLTLEAMKIEYTIRAPQDGIVREAYFKAGDQVKVNDELVDFELAVET
ncbi:acetyl/propionyl/methylcrotonyl-CoA carboxylase subunit alpha [Acinetobacter puyangensis]|uniref:Biotin carboxylase n=1 Tax=Acinetobacter puyangensis TaxID=1096779 RepID=A0A240E2J8_9GAMM|nr:acetyl/propionyl/methylcrotonyl-CoA carboxylase subunit alpha [Acinetobacter puyangensis]SNX42997.1 3-methylcrotonyl-CoA carboxylase alpha subunit [Acinetobacter puyangensis]